MRRLIKSYLSSVKCGQRYCDLVYQLSLTNNHWSDIEFRICLFGVSLLAGLDLMGNDGGDNMSFGGLSAEAVDIAEANKTELIENATNNSGTDFGGLSARSVNITN